MALSRRRGGDHVRASEANRNLCISILLRVNAFARIETLGAVAFSLPRAWDNITGTICNSRDHSNERSTAESYSLS
jgi:hypothetical protein